ncbi:hypothetical protein M422DRAFT_224555 [Sphaerobolus stellatus SS14]|nr:hypothetical protein M422DRAFT_224555 [Sphaerobolus stellatus SS14]
MESKDFPQTDGSAFNPPTRPPPLQIDPIEVPDDADDTPLLSATPSTSSSSTALPNAPQGRPRSLTQSEPSSAPPTGRIRSATVANPPKSAPPGGTPPEREKRKRSRVTPEQLSHLERLFVMDRSPTAAKRKEISEMLGMQERQTQIWFQNRRAKAKTLEGKGKSGFHSGSPSGVDSPPGTPSDYTALEGDLHTLVHEDDPVTFIPCSDLTIGSWRRISTSSHQYDLLAYFSAVKRCLTWFIYSNGYGFKMEIPFDAITSTSFASVSSTQGLATFYLSRPPLFFLEGMSSPSIMGLNPTKVWKPCPDWTEGHQASKVFRHDLIGATVPLVNALKIIPAPEHTSASTMIHAPYSSPDIGIPPMHIPQPPLAALDPPSFPLSVGAGSHLDSDRKRSFSGPPALSPSDSHSHFGLSNPTGSPSYSVSAAGSYSDRSSGFAAVNDFSYRAYSAAMSSHHAPLTDFSTVPISHHAASSRSFSNPSITPAYPAYDQGVSVLQGDERFAETNVNMQFSSASASASSSSPVLLTSAFDPSSLRRQSTNDMDTSAYAADSDAFQDLDIQGQP